MNSGRVKFPTSGGETGTSGGLGVDNCDSGGVSIETYCGSQLPTPIT